MKIKFDKRFKKNFKSRILPHKKLLKKYEDRLEKFIQDKNNAILKDHQLIGTLKGTRSFSITGDIRVIYVLRNPNEAIFLDIGTHNQVY